MEKFEISVSAVIELATAVVPGKKESEHDRHGGFQSVALTDMAEAESISVYARIRAGTES